MSRKPETAAEALALVTHRQIHQDHEGFGCCTPWEWDLTTAHETVDALEAAGWLLRPAVSLPREAPRGREGTLDLTEFGERVLSLLLRGPLSTCDLNTAYMTRSRMRPDIFPKRSFDTPRKRLAELERAGYVRQVMSAGKQVTRTTNGIPYGVWEITDKGRAAVSRDAQASGRAA